MNELFVFHFLFHLIFLPAIYVVQRFWFVRAWNALRSIRSAVLRNSLRALWFVAALFLFVVIVDWSAGHIIPRTPAAHILLSASMIWFGASTLWLIAVLAWRAASRHFRKGPAPIPLNHAVDPQRRSFLRNVGQVGASLPFIAATYGAARQRLSYWTNKVEIPVTGLPSALAGLRIVHLSDLHMGDFLRPSDAHRIVDLANDLRADLAVVTGDFITDRNDPLQACIAELSRLRAPLGVWGCNGNHEIYAEAEDAAQALFHKYGMRLLRQENAVLSWRGASFNLIGVDYQIQKRAELNQMLAGIEPLVRGDMPNVLLSHNPNSFNRASELGIELMLAGHTHGGQVDVEILHKDLNPATFFTSFIAGFYQLPLPGGGTATYAPQQFSSLYVNRGLGTVKVPIRWGVPPEIALLVLVPAPAPVR